MLKWWGKDKVSARNSVWMTHNPTWKYTCQCLALLKWNIPKALIDIIPLYNVHGDLQPPKAGSHKSCKNTTVCANCLVWDAARPQQRRDPEWNFTGVARLLCTKPNFTPTLSQSFIAVVKPEVARFVSPTKLLTAKHHQEELSHKACLCLR